MSTSINTIDDKARALEGTNKAKPIAMSELDSRINNLSGNSIGYFEEIQPSSHIKKVINVNFTKSKISASVVAGNGFQRNFFNVVGNKTVREDLTSEGSYIEIIRNNNTVTLEIKLTYNYNKTNPKILLVNHD